MLYLYVPTASSWHKDSSVLMNKYDRPNNHLDAALQALHLNLQVFFLRLARTTFTFIHLLAKNQFPQYPRIPTTILALYFEPFYSTIPKSMFYFCTSNVTVTIKQKGSE